MINILSVYTNIFVLVFIIIINFYVFVYYLLEMIVQNLYSIYLFQNNNKKLNLSVYFQDENPLK